MLHCVERHPLISHQGHFLFNQRAIKMKLHPVIMQETDVFMGFAAVFIVVAHG